MASESWKRKQQNSMLHNGADKKDGKMKRIYWYGKRERVKKKSDIIEQMED